MRKKLEVFEGGYKWKWLVNDEEDVPLGVWLNSHNQVCSPPVKRGGLKHDRPWRIVNLYCRDCKLREPCRVDDEVSVDCYTPLDHKNLRTDQALSLNYVSKKMILTDIGWVDIEISPGAYDIYYSPPV